MKIHFLNLISPMKTNTCPFLWKLIKIDLNMDRGTSILQQTKPNKDDLVKNPYHKLVFYIIILINYWGEIQIKDFCPCNPCFLYDWEQCWFQIKHPWVIRVIKIIKYCLINIFYIIVIIHQSINSLPSSW